MTKQTLLQGTAILVAAGLFNRVLGFTYQILIINLIGAEGIGIYNMVFPIYIMAIVLSSAGIPLAVSKFVAAEVGKNNHQGVRRIFRIGMVFLTFSGILGTILLYVLIPFLKDVVFPNPQAYVVFRVLLPGIIFISITSGFRGYFQGLMQMTPTAVSMITEQVTRVVTGLFFAHFFLPRGIAYAAMGSGLGMILGELVCMLVIIILYLKHTGRIPRLFISFYPDKPGRLLWQMLAFSIPVSLSRVVATIILSLEATVIPRQLMAAGHSLVQATSMYGQLTGMALPILAIPSILTSSLATAMVPAVSEAHAANQIRLLSDRISESLKVTMCGGLPAVVIFFLVPNEITQLLFHNYEAGNALRILAFGGLFYYLQQTTTGILQGLGEANLPLRNLIIASILELIGLITLVRIPGIGFSGAAWAINISFFVTACLNLLSIVSLVGVYLSVKDLLLKPMLVTAAMALALVSSQSFFGSLIQRPNLNLLLSMLMACLVYSVMLLISGLIPASILARFPRSFGWRRFLR